MNFYLEVLERYLLTRDAGDVDWGEIWRTVQDVASDEWAASKAQLRKTYQRISALLHNCETWDDEVIVGRALAIVVHTA